jgi:hypothetical protein
MVAREKRYQKLTERMYRKVFNLNDPFDRLILELGEKGYLNVCVVGIGDISGKPSSVWGFSETISGDE